MLAGSDAQPQTVEIPANQVGELAQVMPKTQIRQTIQKVLQTVLMHVEQQAEQLVHVPTGTRHTPNPHQYAEQFVGVPIPVPQEETQEMQVFQNCQKIPEALQLTPGSATQPADQIVHVPPDTTHQQQVY